MQHMSANGPSPRMKRCGERRRPISVAVEIRDNDSRLNASKLSNGGAAMSNRWNPIHAAACGIVAGFALFAVMIARSGSWWPNPAASELGLKLLLLLAVSFAIVAVIRNWRLERALIREDATRLARSRRVQRSWES